MSFKPIQKLAVTRTSSSGEHVAVGVLAQNRQGVFGDCLPNGWGMLLQDRIFRQKGILPNQLTATNNYTSNH